MKESVRVAAVALNSHPGETQRNLDLIAEWCRRAKAEGAELVLFPELSVTGFVPNHPVGDHAEWLRQALRGARTMAEPVEAGAARDGAAQGSAVARLCEISRDTGVYVAAGLLEDAGHLLFNT